MSKDWPEPKHVPIKGGSTLNPERIEHARLYLIELTAGEIIKLIPELIAGLPEYIMVPTRVLDPLIAIADAYDDNALDDEARKFWGSDEQNENERNPADIELYSGRGGRRLLTLEDCLIAREVKKYYGRD